jgi:subtilisin family serine protease
MAAPHFAGVAALIAQANPTATAEQIWARLMQNAQTLNLLSRDVGKGCRLRDHKEGGAAYCRPRKMGSCKL